MTRHRVLQPNPTPASNGDGDGLPGLRFPPSPSPSPPRHLPRFPQRDARRRLLQRHLQLWDSIADTGNGIRSNQFDLVGRFPYGETFFHHPTGRYSDGRLIIDFIAQAIGLPMVRPYLAGTRDGEDFRYGANFAVGGATALDNEFFRSKGMEVSWTNDSLSVQLEWFKHLLPSLCSTNCRDLMGESLFSVGEIGGNDYNHAFFQGRGVDEIKTFVPGVVSAIGSAIEELIKLGARTMIVPGNFPIGCVAVYLTMFQSDRREDYESGTGCIEWLNQFSMYHNRLLLDELSQLRRRYPQATIIYANYYEAAMAIVRSPREYGALLSSSPPTPPNHQKIFTCFAM
ncbi:lipid catabolic process [Musa troglodytarum]|uniref:Lipid catabolic process n=1 Tax=Musa troglodytarum TaxID=320322 RepID=A0A9E7KBG7_9LILI|nr:lipid catabolic process [Musa troglodytarum]